LYWDFKFSEYYFREFRTVREEDGETGNEEEDPEGEEK
jgi:hypothetical protein